MPLYDLECSVCGNKSEEFQAMDAKQPTRCAKCGATKVHRVLIKPPKGHNKYEDGHPRKTRGRG
jgi:putative FmdB family regulatory protein